MKINETKTFLKVIMLMVLFLSCGNDSQEEGTTPQATEALVEKGVPYGNEARQFLDIYRADTDTPTPVYFDAHSNGGTTAIPSDIIDVLNAEGITVIAWESLTSVSSPEEVQTGWDDAELMFEWVINNATTYNLDVSNLIIGGSSRGSILSWKYGHAPNPNVKGLYMYNALPGNVWNFPEWWLPSEEVTSASPPVYFVYNREPGSSQNAADPDIHDPLNGQMIVDLYESLGIGDRTTLVHSIGETDNADRYQFLVSFALSVID